jgi:broad specificity phosphatase PhoE
MSVYVIRHAEKEKGDFYCSILPLNNQPISENGKLQALSLVDFFRKLDIESIYVSEYIRAAQTITPVAEAKNIKFSTDKRLNEINIGELDQLSDEEVKNKCPDFWKSYLERKSDFRFPNGESGDEAGARIHDLFCSLDPTKNHILVSHDGIIRTLICKILSLPTYKRHLFRIDLCSITTFDFNLEFHCWTIPQMNLVNSDQ